MNAREERIDFAQKLTPEQAEKIMCNLGIIKHVMKMDTNEGIFARTFLDHIFGEVSE